MAALLACVDECETLMPVEESLERVRQADAFTYTISRHHNSRLLYP
jgi:hypothetical protein